MKLRDWVRIRWLELRFGSTSYLTYFVTFFNLAILVSLRFDINASQFPLLVLGLFVTLASIAVVIGHAHLLWQNPVDIRMQYGPLIEEIVRRIKEVNAN